jgi:hypothetical protein
MKFERSLSYVLQSTSDPGMLMLLGAGLLVSGDKRKGIGDVTMDSWASFLGKGKPVIRLPRDEFNNHGHLKCPTCGAVSYLNTEYIQGINVYLDTCSLCQTVILVEIPLGKPFVLIEGFLTEAEAQERIRAIAVKKAQERVE